MNSIPNCSPEDTTVAGSGVKRLKASNNEARPVTMIRWAGLYLCW